jgi:tetratricopeptide (TPR) repeat protein
MRALRRQLAERALVVLRPTFPGVGATRFASEFGYAFASDYPAGMLWIPHRCSGYKESAADVVDALGLPNRGGLRWPFLSAQISVSRMWHDLGTLRGPVLIVLDGFHGPPTLEDWKPRQPHVHVLAIADPRSAVEDEWLFAVQPLQRADVSAALRQLVPEIDARTGDAFADRVEGDAFTLDVALGMVTEAGVAIEQLLEEVSGAVGRDALLARAVGRQPEDARKVLDALSLLDAEPVPIRLAHVVGEELGLGKETVDAGLDMLVLARLITKARQEDAVIAHRRVLAKGGGASAERRDPVVRALLRAFSDTEDVEALRVLAPHARLAVREGRASPALLSELACAVSRADAARHAFGAEEAERAVAFAREAEGNVGRLTLQALNAQGYVLTELRMLAPAQEVLREALALTERLHGPDSLEAVECVDGLARAIGLGSCGHRPPEALQLKERARAIREKLWGPEDPRLAHACWNVGTTFAAEGNHRSALPLLERAVRLSEKSPTGPWPAYLNTLANLYCYVERVDDALATARRALELHRCTAGFGAVSNTLNAFADGLGRAGRVEEIIVLATEVLDWPGWSEADDQCQLTRASIHELLAATYAALGNGQEASKHAVLALPAISAKYEQTSKRAERLRAISEGRPTD